MVLMLEIGTHGRAMCISSVWHMPYLGIINNLCLSDLEFLIFHWSYYHPLYLTLNHDFDLLVCLIDKLQV